MLAEGGGNCSPALTGDPLLGPLADNGGPTPTFALLLGSPAINAVDAATCADPATVNNLDQRGVTRPQGIACDIGAFELEITNLPPTAVPGGPYLGAVDEAIRFDGTGSSDPDGDPLTYDWSWGDGISSPDAGPTPAHEYAAAEIYEVCLTVSDSGGLSDTACTIAVIYDPDGGFVTGDGSPDTLRIKIWEEDAGGVETVVYDNGTNQPIGRGNIIVHKK